MPALIRQDCVVLQQISRRTGLGALSLPDNKRAPLACRCGHQCVALLALATLIAHGTSYGQGRSSLLFGREGVSLRGRLGMLSLQDILLLCSIKRCGLDLLPLFQNSVWIWGSQLGQLDRARYSAETLHAQFFPLFVYLGGGRCASWRGLPAWPRQQSRRSSTIFRDGKSYL